MKNRLIISVVLIIFFTLLIKPCTSFQLIDVHPSLLTSLPRKLMFLEKDIKTEKHIKSQVKVKVKAKEEIMGGLKKKDVKVMQITSEKWREWEEAHDPSELFTMDYRRVRRRRPIHNKSMRGP